jgi:hypothetical protein
MPKLQTSPLEQVRDDLLSWTQESAPSVAVLMHQLNSEGKQIVSAFPGKCCLCGQSYKRGEEIVWIPGKACHTICPGEELEPSRMSRYLHG